MANGRFWVGLGGLIMDWVKYGCDPQSSRKWWVKSESGWIWVGLTRNLTQIKTKFHPTLYCVSICICMIYIYIYIYITRTHTHISSYWSQQLVDANIETQCGIHPIYIYRHMCVYIYIYVCVCVCRELVQTTREKNIKCLCPVMVA